VETNRYPALVEWIGRQVEVRIRAEQILIGAGSSDALVYSRLSGKHKAASWEGAPRSFARALDGAGRSRRRASTRSGRSPRVRSPSARCSNMTR
jgi:hypothetical protein